MKILTLVRTDFGHLYNIANGCSACQNTEDFLLNIFKIGSEERIKFIPECIECPDRLEKVIKMQKLHNFTTEAGIKTIENKHGKLIETCLVCDLFGSILFLSLQKRIDMAEVMMPLSLSHVNGAMLKTEVQTFDSLRIGSNNTTSISYSCDSH